MKTQSYTFLSQMVNGYQWIALFLLGILAWAGKELYGVVITRQFDALRAEMAEDRDEYRKQCDILRDQNTMLLQMISDMRVEIATIGAKM